MHTPNRTERGVQTRDGLVLHTLRWDPAPNEASGRTFLLVHGLASNALMWSGVGSRLAIDGHVVVAVDQRGHGRSSRPGRSFDAELLAEDLRGVIDSHALDTPVIVGQSWGGNVALDTAHRHPRHASAVVAVDGGTIDLHASFPDLDAALEAMRPPRLAGTPFVEIETGIRERHLRWPEEAIQAALANFDVRDDGTAEPRLEFDEHLAILRQMWQQRPSAWFRDLTVPVLLLMVPSGHDEAWAAVKREQVSAAQRAGSHVSCRWLDGYDHDLHAQAPDVVVHHVLDWLLEVAR